MDTLYLLATHFPPPKTPEEKAKMKSIGPLTYDEISEGVPIMDQLNLVELSDQVEAAFATLPLAVRIDRRMVMDTHRVKRLRDLTMIHPEIRATFERWVETTGAKEFSDEYNTEMTRMFGDWGISIYIKPAVGILEGKSQAFIEAYIKLSGGLGKELLQHTGE